MSDDQLQSIPPIVPTRDDGDRGSGSRKPSPRGNSKGGGAGIFTRLFLVVALTGAAAACAWAWQLQQELNRLQASTDYEQRIKDLEDRLSDTDEGMNQSSAVQAAKIKELYSEVDKLWASAWRKNKAKIAELERQSAAQAKTLKSATADLAGAKKTLASLNDDMKRLNAVAQDLEGLGKSARSAQAEVERLGDDVNRLQLEAAKLTKRVSSNEEWVASVNAFRRQVNSSIGDMQTSIRILQAGQ
ncbi:MAG: hypothetical protein CSA53_02035 [Gammaproteobacteria bacterium]|nr:MAG: hypothetical protein CSA53_02035 [Gammaproteobacteria bacterium]